MKKSFKFVNNNTYVHRKQRKQVVLDYETVNSLCIFVKLSQPSSPNTMQKVPVMHFYSNNGLNSLPATRQYPYYIPLHQSMIDCVVYTYMYIANYASLK